MPRRTDTWTGKSQHGVFSSLVFRHAVIFLLLTHSHGGQCQENEKILAEIGDVVTLPCRVQPATNVVDTMLEWSRPDLQPRFIHVRRSGEDRLVDQHPSYKGRTSVSIDGLKQGDMSLRLSKVRFSDQGTYRCFIPEFNVDSRVQLVVDAVIKISNVSSGVLKCESTGWNLVPEVSWLDADGKQLSAEPTVSVKGSDDLYSVSSKVTVERKHGRSFTCRVTQKTINQTREAIIKVSDDFFPNHSGSNVGAVIGAIIGTGFVLAVVFYVWKRHKDNKGKKVDEEERQSRNSSRSNASEEERLLKTKAETGTVTAGKPEEKRLAHEKEDLPHPASSKTEGETNNTASKEQSDPVGAGSKSVVENEGQQQSQVQTMSDLDNKKEKAESVRKANPDQAEREDTSRQENHQPPGGDCDLGTKREEKIEDEGSPVNEPLESEKANDLDTNKHQDNHTPAGEGKDGDLEPKKEETTAARKETKNDDDPPDVKEENISDNTDKSNQYTTVGTAAQSLNKVEAQEQKKEKTTAAGKNSSCSTETKDNVGSSVDETPDVKEENISGKNNKDKSNKSTTDETAAQNTNSRKKVETQESGPAAGGGTDSKQEEKRNKPDKSKPPPRPPRTFTASGDPESKPANSALQSPADEHRDEDDKKAKSAETVPADQSQPPEDTAEGKPEDKNNPVSQKPDPPSSTNQDTKTATDGEESSPNGGGETEQSQGGNDNTGVGNTGGGGTIVGSSTPVNNCPENKSASREQIENMTDRNADAQDQQ